MTMKASIERFLGICARRAVLRERTKIRAVVGSIGKTSTKEAIGIALGAGLPGSRTRISPKNYNNELGVPLTIFDVPAPGSSVVAWIHLLWRAIAVGIGMRAIGANALVLEFGTDHPGDIEYLMNIALPNLVVMTAISAEHTEFFGSIDGVAQEELTALRMLPKTGVAILNADDPRVLQGRELTQATVITYGQSPQADVRIVNTHISTEVGEDEGVGLDVEIVAFGFRAVLRLQGVFGTSQAFAVAAALAVAFALDVDFYEAVDRLRSYHGVPGRTRILKGIKYTTLLDDSYNSSPAAAATSIQDLAAFPIASGCRRFAAIGDMLELGALAEQSHADVGRKVAECAVDFLVACGTLAHVVADAAKQAGMSPDRVFVFPTSHDAGIFIQHEIKQGDVVLIKGSRGMRMEVVTKELMAEPEKADTLLVSHA